MSSGCCDCTPLWFAFRCNEFCHFPQGDIYNWMWGKETKRYSSSLLVVDHLFPLPRNFRRRSYSTSWRQYYPPHIIPVDFETTERAQFHFFHSWSQHEILWINPNTTASSAEMQLWRSSKYSTTWPTDWWCKPFRGSHETAAQARSSTF